MSEAIRASLLTLSTETGPSLVSFRSEIIKSRSITIVNPRRDIQETAKTPILDRAVYKRPNARSRSRAPVYGSINKTHFEIPLKHFYSSPTNPLRDIQNSFSLLLKAG